jgi:hypothetical protein
MPHLLAIFGLTKRSLFTRRGLASDGRIGACISRRVGGRCARVRLAAEPELGVAATRQEAPDKPNSTRTRRMSRTRYRHTCRCNRRRG